VALRTRGFILAIFFINCITSMVQLFYAHKVWIISDRNRFLTLLVIAATITQFLSGSLAIAEIVRTPTFAVFSSTRYMPVSAIARAVCDAVVTISVFYYLRPARTGNIRETKFAKFIRRLNLVFMQMGLLSFLDALATVIIYYVQYHQPGQYLVLASALVLSKTYVNCMLAVLNARQSNRKEEQYRTSTIEVPTLPTIY